MTPRSLPWRRSERGGVAWDGDVWYLNLPEVGGNHLPDVKAIRPVFAGGRLAAFAINLAHWADIGGAVPGSYVPWADEAVQEGLRIAPIKVFDRKGPTRAFDLIMANLRGREEREGDCRAMYSAVEVGARCLWLQQGIANEEAGRIAHEAGLSVVMDRCTAVEAWRVRSAG